MCPGLTTVPIKFSKNAAMLIPMRVADALRTKGASTSQVHGLVPTRCSGFASSTSLCVTPLRLTLSLRTSYLITLASSCSKVTAHHQAFNLFGTGVMPSFSPAPTPVPIKFSKNAAMPIPMRVTDALRTKGASTSQVHGLVPTRCSGFASSTSLCVTPLRLTLSLRTSYLITLASSCSKVTAHHEVHIFLGTDVVGSALGLADGVSVW